MKTSSDSHPLIDEHDTPRGRGRFIRNLAQFQTELARIQAGFIPSLAVWTQRKELPELVFRTFRRIQELRVRSRELGVGVADVHLSAATPARSLLDLLCHAQTNADFLHGAFSAISAAAEAAIRDYLRSTEAVADLPSIPLLEANADELAAQKRWGEAALASVGDQPSKTFTAALADLCADLRESLHTHNTVHATAVKSARHLGVLPFADAVLPHGFTRFESGPEVVANSAPYAQRARFHAVNFLQEVQAADSCASMLFEAPDMPWEFFFDLARHMWDEMRHATFGENKLADIGETAAAAGLSTRAYALRQTLAPVDRYAALSTQEADAFPGKHIGLQQAMAHGDRVSAIAWSYDIADETQHVRYGAKWIPVLLEHSGDPRSIEQVKADAYNWRASVLAHSYKPAASLAAR